MCSQSPLHQGGAHQSRSVTSLKTLGALPGIGGCRRTTAYPGNRVFHEPTFISQDRILSELAALRPTDDETEFLHKYCSDLTDSAHEYADRLVESKAAFKDHIPGVRRPSPVPERAHPVYTRPQASRDLKFAARERIWSELAESCTTLVQVMGKFRNADENYKNNVSTAFGRFKDFFKVYIRLRVKTDVFRDVYKKAWKMDMDSIEKQIEILSGLEICESVGDIIDYLGRDMAYKERVKNAFGISFHKFRRLCVEAR